MRISDWSSDVCSADLFVAEFAMGQMLNLSRRLVHVGDAFRQHSWERGKEIAYGGTQLKGKTVGIIGFGAIGKALASMCRNGFAMNVVAAKRRGQNYSEPADVKRLELDELLSVDRKSTRLNYRQ